MIVNPVIVLDGKKSDHRKEQLINNRQIKTVSPVKLLCNQIDNRLNFNVYISNIFRLAANQQDFFIGLKK